MLALNSIEAIDGSRIFFLCRFRKEGSACGGSLSFFLMEKKEKNGASSVEEDE